ncbi:MAG: hypothetical protein ABIH24_05400 [Verrucomicrobiota bacterium]
MKRKAEIQRLLQLTPGQLLSRAKGRLTILDNLNLLHQHFAARIAATISENNLRSRPTRLILPVGPFEQYPLLAGIINNKKIDMSNCRFFFMDEYCDDNGKALPSRHPLSLRRNIEHNFLPLLQGGCGLKSNQVVFPNRNNLRYLARMIKDAGGIDICFAGVGIHGHLAFNEPGRGVAYTHPRQVQLNAFTITMNAIRAGVGGDLHNFPHKALTLGMQQLLSARKIFIYCRNDVPGIDWANAILRLALFGEPGDDYPVTYIRNKDYHIVTTKDTAAVPKVILCNC